MNLNKAMELLKLPLLHESEFSKSYVNAIKELLDKHQLEIKWIPVSEELPKKDEYVLASFDDGFVTGVEYDKNGEWGLWQGSGEVVAWKPMPEPYVPEPGINIKLMDIKSKALKDMPCSVCHGNIKVKELHINNTIHAVCEKCRKIIVKQIEGVGERDEK